MLNNRLSTSLKHTIITKTSFFPGEDELLFSSGGKDEKKENGYE